jgi:4-amino-4-deoxy-L-arabinose transferase-like glycosyltransferase
VVVFVLRVTQIHQSLLEDEVFTYHDVVHHSFSSLLSGVYTGGENSPPLFFLLAWLSAKLGDPSVWIRLPSIVFSTATVPVVYLLGRQAVGRATGLMGAAVVTLSPFGVYYGVEARPYATMAFFAALSTLALLKALDTRSLGWWLVYSLAAAGAAYTHYTSVFVLAVQAIWSLWVSRDRLRDPLLANLLVILLYLPWLPHVRGKQLLTFEHLEPLTAANMLKDVARVIPGYPYASLRGIPTLVGLAALGICLLVGTAGAIGDTRARGRLSANPRGCHC